MSGSLNQDKNFNIGSDADETSYDETKDIKTAIGDITTSLETVTSSSTSVSTIPGLIELYTPLSFDISSFPNYTNRFWYNTFGEAQIDLFSYPVKEVDVYGNLGVSAAYPDECAGPYRYNSGGGPGPRYHPGPHVVGDFGIGFLFRPDNIVEGQIVFSSSSNDSVLIWEDGRLALYDQLGGTGLDIGPVLVPKTSETTWTPYFVSLSCSSAGWSYYVGRREPTIPNTVETFWNSSGPEVLNMRQPTLYGDNTFWAVAGATSPFSEESNITLATEFLSYLDPHQHHSTSIAGGVDYLWNPYGGQQANVIPFDLGSGAGLVQWAFVENFGPPVLATPHYSSLVVGEQDGFTTLGNRARGWWQTQIFMEFVASSDGTYSIGGISDNPPFILTHPLYTWPGNMGSQVEFTAGIVSLTATFKHYIQHTASSIYPANVSWDNGAADITINWAQLTMTQLSRD